MTPQSISPEDAAELGVGESSLTRRRGRRLPALADGGVLRLDSNAPRTLQQTLCRAASSFPEHGVRYVQPDGSDQFQSFVQLLDQAKSIGASLRQRGFKPGQIVLFQLPSAGKFIPGFWGCVWAGLVPAPIGIPPGYERGTAALGKLLNSCKLLNRPVVLTSESLAKGMRSWMHGAGLDRLEIVVLESLMNGRAPVPDVSSDPEQPALMMLTSGSTGPPKGVPLTHRNLICRSIGSVQMNGFTSGEISLNWMPLDHVAGLIYFHLRDVFLGCHQVQIPTALILEDSLRWLDAIERHRASITFAPNFAYALVNDRAGEISQRHWDLSSMRWVLNGAEPIVARTARRFLELLIPHGLPPDAMRPAWGMSETSSGVTYSDRFSLETVREGDAFVEVGAPIPGFAMRIVDAENRLLEEGEIGQLQVSGLTVMQGYYKNAPLNAEVFTDDGWFETGDLGYLRDGRLTVTGREKDVIIINSVNYYGHEIEGAVEQLRGVEPSFTAACGVRNVHSDTDRLAIFFSPSDPSEARLPELIQEIRAQVVRQISVYPDFILPVPQETIPKTEIGKIQRAKLKAQFEAGAFELLCQRWKSDASVSRPPRTPLEKQLARVWEEVLERQPIGIDQNFFEAGGDSLRATRIVSRLRERFQLDLSLRALFEECSTIATMAQCLEQKPSADCAPRDSIARAERVGPIPLCFSQQRIWLMDQLESGSSLYNIPIAIRLRGPLNISALEQSLRHLAERHEILRTSFPLSDSGPVQVIGRGASVVIERVSLAPGVDEESLARELEQRAVEPFDLVAGPAWRACLFPLGEKEHVMLLLFHQIVIDGWSLGFLFDELAAGYLAALGMPDPRCPLPAQCADFALWQRQPSAMARIERSIEYWKSQLAPPWPAMDLKPDFAAPPRNRIEGATLSRELPMASTTALRQFAQREGASPFMLFLAVYMVLLRHRTGESDLRVGTAVSGRQLLELEKLIGFFVNTLVIRVRLDEDSTFRQLLRQVRETVLMAYAHQDAPYEKVIETLREREPGRQPPIFSTWFGLQDPMRPFAAGELICEPAKVNFPLTQFDLSLFLAEDRGQWRAIVEYRTSLFKSETIGALLDQFEHVLLRASEDPDCALRSFSAQ